MLVKEFPGNVFYIENAFEHAQEFIDNLERFDKDPSTHSVIPPWEDWHDAEPVLDESGLWVDIPHDEATGRLKEFNWNKEISNHNTIWPIPDFELDETRKLLEPTINLIHEPYLKVLDLWCEKTGNKKLEYVSKNYTLKKYNPGGAIWEHIDINPDNDSMRVDWSALFYLNDNYEGGEIEFTRSGIKLRPSAGSALIFPTTEPHAAREVLEGNKYFIFMMISTKHGYSIALNEEHGSLNGAIESNMT